MGKYDVELERSANDPLNIMLGQIKSGSTVLEFGCASGRMTQYMSQNMGCEVYIVEYVEGDYEIAKMYAEDGVCGDIMQMEWLRKFASIRFDYIVFADVLEHLSDPKTVLQAAVKLLKEDGVIWISVPNIAHNDIILNLYHNKFQYTSTGLLDNTHIHFFTYEHLLEICDMAGLTLLFVDCTSVQTDCTEQRLMRKVEESDLLELLIAREMGEIYQYVVGVVHKDSQSFADINLENRMIEHLNPIERKFFFDKGEDFDQYDYKRCKANRKESKFIEKVEVPYGTLRVRFDPVEKIPCIIYNLKVYCSNGEELEVETNADVVGKEYYFRNYDPQIIVTLDKPVDWLVFEGEITYSYDIITEIETQGKRLRKEIEEHQAAKDLIAKQNVQLTELSLKIEIAERIREKTEKKLELEAEVLNKQYQKRLELLRTYKDEVIQSRDSIIQNLQSNCETYIQKYQLIEDSTFWKITKPIRMILDMLKRKEVMESEIPVALPVSEFQQGGLEEIDSVISEDLTWDYDACAEESRTPLVSVIVPNYNHASYLRERLESIYSQTYANYEVILLDDCSNDNSRLILDEYANAYKDRTVKAYNQENCGKVFKQWDKGIDLAKGSLIWIAESDDYCEPDFLEEMVSLFKYDSVMLAFARSVFMQEGRQVWSTEEYLSDLPKLKWGKAFTMTAHNLVNAGWGIKNIIPNVSSAVFRNVGVFSEEQNPIWERLKLCGDWIFYLNLIKGGCVSYTNQTTNYYRVHAQSTSLNVQKTEEYYREQCEVSKFVVKNYNVDLSMFDLVRYNLKEHYKAIQCASDGNVVDKYYSLEDIKSEQEKRSPNILMTTFSMKMGGGETYPLFLANQMKSMGLSVTVLDFCMDTYNEQVRELLNANVPLVEMKNLDYFYHVVTQLGGEIIHSHHASVDGAIASWLNDHSSIRCKHIVSLHGMYEAIGDEDCKNTLERVTKSCSKFIYTADKNLTSIVKYGYEDQIQLEKMENGLPEKEVQAIERDTLGIGKNDFVLCLVSRALPEKGWHEASEAVKRANNQIEKNIHLLLIGDGEMKDQMMNEKASYIHLLGAKANIRDYFAMSDVGFLPTRYPGESFPLVIIDSLMCHKPVIATDLGEIKNQISTEEGELAGILLHLNDWKLDIEEMSQAILKLARSNELYQELVLRTESASKKFNIERVVDRYLKIYKDVLKQ